MRNPKWFSLLFMLCVVAACGTDHITNVEVKSQTVPVTGVVVGTPTLNLSLGTCGSSSYQLSIGFIPANATNQAFLFGMTGHGAVKIDANGLVTALKAGTDTITVISAADSTKKTQVVATVTTCGPPVVAVTGISVSPTNFTLNVGASCTNTTQQLSATILPANATNQNYTTSVTSHGSVSVSQTGLVTAIKAGVDSIAVVASGDTTKKVLVEVTVINSSCASTGMSITLTPASTSGNKGTTTQITATVTAPAGVDKSVTWYSTDVTRVLVALKDGASITVGTSVALTNLKGGTVYFLATGTAQVCAKSVVDPTVLACVTMTTN